jgi:DMSO/TMAO reductase YedYZ molybdopterin-dependent catalytic subunit
MPRHHFAAAVAALSLAGLAHAAGPGTLTVGGDLPSPGSLTVADLRRLQPEALTVDGHDGKHRGQGVRLDKVLAHFGFTPGPMGKDVSVRDKRSGWKKAVRATAADGFEAVFSCAELAESMGPTRAYVLYELDGKPLPAEVGPFRIVVPTDKEPSRSLRQLVRLEVLDLRASKR